jgi:hypothetical protein
VARPRYREESRGRPEPLPPDTRTVGQLVAETLRLYGRRVWASLAIGIPPAVLTIVVASLDGVAAALVSTFGGALILTLSYLAAVVIAHRPPLTLRTFLVAYALGILVFLPFSVLVRLYVLPGLAWLALVGLAVPAALVEGLGARAALRRGFALARADYVHVLGGLATLAIAVVLSTLLAAVLLQDLADNTARAAGFIAGAVISPILFLGAALLYEDQSARLDRRLPEL